MSSHTRVIAPHRSGSRPRGGCPARVLVVDHDPIARGFLEASLVSSGYDTVGVPDAAEALACLREAATSGLRLADVLALDIVLPDMPLLSLLERIRESGCDAPAILIAPSPYWLHALWSRARELGVVSAFARPFSLGEFESAVAQALARSSLHTPAA